MKQKMVISFSGGRTSAFMTKMLLDIKSDEYDFIVIFANTGQEHEKTLEFIRNCDTHFGFNTVWVESVVHHGQRKGNTHKVVNFETATRDGTLFEEMIKKHGIPNMAFPHCTRELKLAPINSYLKSIGWTKKNSITAIGIRIDETRRVRKDATTAKIIYPLVDTFPSDKQDVLDYFCNESDFDLGLAEHNGNCTWCWKKSMKKHLILIKETPDIFEVPRRMEKLYPNTGAHKDKSIPRTFFRGNRSTINLFELNEALDEVVIDDLFSPCGESCELYATE